MQTALLLQVGVVLQVWCGCVVLWCNFMGGEKGVIGSVVEGVFIVMWVFSMWVCFLCGMEVVCSLLCVHLCYMYVGPV